MNRSSRSRIAQETVEILERGSYGLRQGAVVDFSPMIEACLQGTRFYAPEQLEQIRDAVLSQPAPGHETGLDVRNETTLAGVFRVLAETGGPVAALNFASAKNPGGGFLSGSQAQEESLARSSALYASLLRAPEYYERHRASPSCLYSDAMVLSPGCPVFRNDQGELLEQPVQVTFITGAAPNAGAIASNTPSEGPLIQDTFKRRTEYVLALAAYHRVEALVLGAWGCGVFRNDPVMVADAFAEHLSRGAAWSDRFRRVVFSVLDTSPTQETFGAFHRIFGENA